MFLLDYSFNKNISLQKKSYNQRHLFLFFITNTYVLLQVDRWFWKFLRKVHGTKQIQYLCYMKNTSMYLTFNYDVTKLEFLDENFKNRSQCSKKVLLKADSIFHLILYTPVPRSVLNLLLPSAILNKEFGIAKMVTRWQLFKFLQIL